MATVEGHPKIELRLTFALSEEEARALDAMAGYGDDAFVKVFYAELGESYMKKHEAGLRSLLKSAREQLPAWLSRVDSARMTFVKVGA